jgi:hypothetical protein
VIGVVGESVRVGTTAPDGGFGHGRIGSGIRAAHIVRRGVVDFFAAASWKRAARRRRTIAMYQRDAMRGVRAEAEAGIARTRTIYAARAIGRARVVSMKTINAGWRGAAPGVSKR